MLSFFLTVSNEIWYQYFWRTGGKNLSHAIGHGIKKAGPSARPFYFPGPPFSLLMTSEMQFMRRLIALWDITVSA